MSQENVDHVRRLYALIDQDDESFWGLVGPEFVFNFSRRLIDPVIRRRDEARVEYDRGRHELMADGHIGWEPRELIDAGDKVLAFIRTSFRGKASSVDVEAYVWNVWTFRDGELVEWTYFRR